MMKLLWDTLPCSNLMLCQFMANYELSAQDYLVAHNDSGHIVGAGTLAVNNNQAHLDIYVDVKTRYQGIGRELVKRLIAEANQQGLERLTGHGEAGFWLSLNFEPLANNQYSLLLPAAQHSLVNTWHQGIPVTKFLALSISHACSQRVETSACMTQSINVHQSMFAGAIYSQAVLTAWGLIHLRAQQAGVEGAIVLASGDITYFSPITQQPRGVVIDDIALDTFDIVTAGKKLTLELVVNMFQGDASNASAQFIGRYVMLPKA